MFIYLSFFVSALLIQNACSNFIGKRNIVEPFVAQTMCYPSPIPMPCPKMDIPPFVEPSLYCSPMYVPETYYYPMPYPEVPGMPTHGLCDMGVGAVVVEEPVIVEAPCVTEVPLISTVSFGNASNAVFMALSPLMEAADADVALLMFTKINAI